MTQSKDKFNNASPTHNFFWLPKQQCLYSGRLCTCYLLLISCSFCVIANSDAHNLRSETLRQQYQLVRSCSIVWFPFSSIFDSLGLILKSKVKSILSLLHFPLSSRCCFIKNWRCIQAPMIFSIHTSFLIYTNEWQHNIAICRWGRELLPEILITAPTSCNMVIWSKVWIPFTSTWVQTLLTITSLSWAITLCGHILNP